MNESTSTFYTGTVRAPNEPAPHALSTTTRLLSAGVYMDDLFADAVIKELIDNKYRFVAPSYGYNALPVLGHALMARSRRKLVRGLSACSLAIALLIGSLGSVFLGLFLLLWLIWAVVFLDRLTVRQILTQRLKASRAGDIRFDGSTPEHPLLTTADRKRIGKEQDGDSGVVYYGGYRPFIGAGARVRSWSFPILLNPDEGQSSVIEFTGDEMMAHLQEKLERVLHTEVAEVQQIQTLEITRRWYRTAIGRRRPKIGDQMPRPPRVGEEGYDAAREYLCIRVGTWEQELVNSIFINFDIRGQTLYSELHNYVLLPLRAAFHEVDRLPQLITSKRVGKIALESLFFMISAALGGLVAVPATVLRFLGRKAAAKNAVEPADDPRAGDEDDDEPDPAAEDSEAIKNFGAKRSVREMGSASEYHHFFQSVDATKYAKIVERRTMEIIIDYLESKNVDTSEYRARQTAILNYGILQTGNGQIINTGNLAVGENSTVSGG